MRWLAVLVVSAAGVALAAAGLFLLRDDGPEELLPDLDQAVPSRLEIVEEGDSYRLVFASAVDNVGRGPLLIEGERPEPGDARHGGHAARPPHGRRRSRARASRRDPVRGDRDPRALAPARLRGLRASARPATGRWCGRARRPASASATATRRQKGARVEGKPERAVWTDECGRDQPGLLTLRQGISPGYGDDYDPALEGQFVDVTNVPPGRYLLVHRTNPERSIEEASYENNAASVLIQLRRSGAIPTVRVLARCPDADTCRRG